MLLFSNLKSPSHFEANLPRILDTRFPPLGGENHSSLVASLALHKFLQDMRIVVLCDRFQSLLFNLNIFFGLRGCVAISSVNLIRMLQLNSVINTFELKNAY